MDIGFDSEVFVPFSKVAVGETFLQGNCVMMRIEDDICSMHRYDGVPMTVNAIDLRDGSMWRTEPDERVVRVSCEVAIKHVRGLTETE